MTLPEVIELFDYWARCPPENEFLAMFARVYTTWEPQGVIKTKEDAEREHMKSLERRWAAGALNPKQLLDALGGRLPGSEAGPKIELKDPAELPGIGRFPGVH